MRYITLFIIVVLLLTGCSTVSQPADIAATTLPVYEFTQALCQDTPLTVTRLITEEVSCLHDYSLNVSQVKAAEAAGLIALSGGGLEDFMGDLLDHSNSMDASIGMELICPEVNHEHEHGHEGHNHDRDPHFWLSPAHAKIMAENLCNGLIRNYPEYEVTFRQNLLSLTEKLDALQRYGNETLSDLTCRELITFHDGFAYFADAFHLTILEAVEEESGSEASAKELIHLIEEVEHHNLPAIFTEKSGSVSAAGVIARETGCGQFTLDMAMAGDSYFEAMYHNLDTIQEAMG